MSLTARKVFVASVIGFVLLVANLVALAGWLERSGVIAKAQRIREEYLTGTAITVIVAMFVLVAPPAILFAARRCRVCEAFLFRRGKYCPGCGSRVSQGSEKYRHSAIASGE